MNISRSRINLEKPAPRFSGIFQVFVHTIIHPRTKDAIQDRLGIVDHENSELVDLEMEARPEDVLAEIYRLRAIESGKR